MSKWRVWMQSDLLRGRWLENYRTFLTHQLFYILAKKGNVSYIHFCSFMDDWDGADALLQRILACENFTPEGKPTIWTPARDIQPYRWRTPRDWRWMVIYKR